MHAACAQQHAAATCASAGCTWQAASGKCAAVDVCSGLDEASCAAATLPHALVKVTVRLHCNTKLARRAASFHRMQPSAPPSLRRLPLACPHACSPIVQACTLATVNLCVTEAITEPNVPFGRSRSLLMARGRRLLETPAPTVVLVNSSVADTSAAVNVTGEAAQYLVTFCAEANMSSSSCSSMNCTASANPCTLSPLDPNTLYGVKVSSVPCAIEGS